MTKFELLKRLQELVDEFEKARVFGKLEITFYAGRAELIRREYTEKPQVRETTHEYRTNR